MSIEDDDLVVDEEIVVDKIEEEEVIEDSETSEESEPESIQADDEEDDEEDRIVTIGDPEPEEETEHKEAPKWVKKVRKANRKLESEVKRLKRQLESEHEAATAEKPVELGEKPTLANCKYDDAKYESELITYYERKRKVDAQAAEKAKAVEDQTKQYVTKQKRYVDLKTEHGFKDFEEAEEAVSNTFSQAQQSILVQGADDSALVVYALGKNPKKLEELAKIQDPVTFAFKVSKLETQLKMTNKKAPKPEKRIASSSSGNVTSVDLDRLREQAAKTGDYTKVLEYKKAHKG